jgi:hypothetical protein
MPTRVVHVSLAIFGAVLTVVLITTFPKLYPAAVFGAESISEVGAGSVQVAVRSTPVPGDPTVNAPAETPTSTVTPTDGPL